MNQDGIKIVKDSGKKDDDSYYIESELIQNLTDKQFKEFKNNLEADPDYKTLKESFILDEPNKTIRYVLYKVYEKEVLDLTHEERLFYPLCNKQEIKRIFSPKNAKDFLLKLRAEQIIDDMRLFRVFTSIRIAKKDKWNFSNYFSTKYFADYLKALPLKIQRICKNIPAGTIHLREANGYCMNSEFGNIIVISYSLRYFLFYMNLFHFGSQLGISSGDCFSAFLIAVRTMLGTETLDFEIDNRGKLPDEVEKKLNTATDWQMKFIAGHEYSHHCLNHINRTKLWVLNSVSLRVQDTRFYSYSEANELEADYFAVTKPLSNKLNRSDLADAAFTFFLYLDLYECVEHYLFPPTSGKRSHPEPIDRLLELRRKLDPNIGSNSERLKLLIEKNTSFKKELIKEYLPFNVEQLEIYASVYLPTFKGKMKLDRLHF